MKSRTIETSINLHCSIGLDRNIQSIYPPDQGQQGEFVDRLRGDLPQTLNGGVQFQQIEDNIGKCGSCKPAEHCFRVSLYRLIILAQEPFEEALRSIDFVTNNRGSEGETSF